MRTASLNTPMLEDSSCAQHVAELFQSMHAAQTRALSLQAAHSSAQYRPPLLGMLNLAPKVHGICNKGLLHIGLTWNRYLMKIRDDEVVSSSVRRMQSITAHETAWAVGSWQLQN